MKKGAERNDIVLVVRNKATPAAGCLRATSRFPPQPAAYATGLAAAITLSCAAKASGWSN
jgi:hypothetical protein